MESARLQNPDQTEIAMAIIQAMMARQNITTRTLVARDTNDITTGMLLGLLLLFFIVLITGGICCCINGREYRKLERDRKVLMEGATSNIRILGTRPAVPEEVINLRPKYIIPDSQMVVCEDGTLMSLQPVVNRDGDLEIIDPEQAARTRHVIEFWNQSSITSMRPSYNELNHDDPPPPAEFAGLRAFPSQQNRVPDEESVIR